jgi:hypothetical protein
MNAARYVERNTYHRVRNVDDRTFHLLSIVNAADSVVNIEPVPAGEGGNLLNNAWFAEHRVNLDAGQTSGSLSFDNDVVLVQFSDDGESYVVEDGVTHSAKSAVGAWSWHAAGSTFQIINGSDDPLEMLVVEVKNQISAND